MADKCAVSEDFKVRYEVDDGYVGGSRPLYVHIRSSEIEDDMSDGELRDLFTEIVQNDFEQRVRWHSRSEEDFVEWARKQIAARQSE